MGSGFEKARFSFRTPFPSEMGQGDKGTDAQAINQYERG